MGSIRNQSDRRERLAESVGACVSIADIADLIQVSKRTAQNMLADGRLPEPDLRLGKRIVRWRLKTIEHWLETVSTVEVADG